MGDSLMSGRKASILSAALVAAGGKAFMMAADFEDAIGATGQIFSDNADIVKGWAETLGTEYGNCKERKALEYSNLNGFDAHQHRQADGGAGGTAISEADRVGR